MYRLNVQIKKICKMFEKDIVYIQLIREFDPGSGLTLAAHIRHASRTDLIDSLRFEAVSGGLVSNT